MKYVVPKIFCALGTIAILAGIFLSELNITLGNMQKSILFSAIITAGLLFLACLVFKMKTTNRKFEISKNVEILSVILFAIVGITSLRIFNHCFTIWQRTGEIKESLNIRQLENMLPDYETYANKRIYDYTAQLDEAIRYRRMRITELADLGFDLSSSETLESQKTRKINKLTQVVYPHIYNTLKVKINDSITSFINAIESYSPYTIPKNITNIKKRTESWEEQLVGFSQYKMKGETAEIFRFVTTFGNVEDILTDYNDYFSSKRVPGYVAGLIFLLFMLFPYFFARRSDKLN